MAVSTQVYRDFADWVLSDLALRRTQRGSKLSRARRRKERIKGENRKIFLKGKHICWQGHEFRDSDFPWRIALAVTAYKKARDSEKEACTCVSNSEIAVNHRGHTKRNRRKNKSQHEPDMSPQAETLRITSSRYIKNHPFFESKFQMWFNLFRSEFARDKSYLEEAISDCRLNIVHSEKSEGPNHWTVGRWKVLLGDYLFELGAFSDALDEYNKALPIWENAPYQEGPFGRGIYLPHLLKQIAACQNREDRCSE
jgi:hypothetical protein